MNSEAIVDIRSIEPTRADVPEGSTIDGEQPYMSLVADVGVTLQADGPPESPAPSAVLLDARAVGIEPTGQTRPPSSAKHGTGPDFGDQTIPSKPPSVVEKTATLVDDPSVETTEAVLGEEHQTDDIVASPIVDDARPTQQVGIVVVSPSVGKPSVETIETRTDPPPERTADFRGTPPEAKPRSLSRVEDLSTDDAEYRLVARLGAGPEADLFLAERQRQGGNTRSCAVKRLREQNGAMCEVRSARFALESAIAVTLRHPHLVRVLDYGLQDGLPFLVREFVDGVNLFELVRRCDGAVPTEHIATIGWHLSQALEYAHTKRDDDGRPLHLVHGEISPATILVARDGKAKITELGVTMLTGQPLRPQVGGRIGHFGYSAPEQDRGAAIDHRADYFSLGVAVGELIGGGPLLSEGARNHADVADEIVARAKKRGDVPRDLADVLVSMTAVNPDERPRKAIAVVRAFEDVVDELGIRDDAESRLKRLLTTSEGGGTSRPSTASEPRSPPVPRLRKLSTPPAPVPSDMLPTALPPRKTKPPPPPEQTPAHRVSKPPSPAPGHRSTPPRPSATPKQAHIATNQAPPSAPRHLSSWSVRAPGRPIPPARPPQRIAKPQRNAAYSKHDWWFAFGALMAALVAFLIVLVLLLQ